jgi:hypothetical protein
MLPKCPSGLHDSMGRPIRHDPSSHTGDCAWWHQEQTEQHALDAAWYSHVESDYPNPNAPKATEPATEPMQGTQESGWIRVLDPHDHRRTAHWRATLPDGSWLTVKELKGGCRQYEWTWWGKDRNCPKIAEGRAYTLVTARHHAGVAVYRAGTQVNG